MTLPQETKPEVDSSKEKGLRVPMKKKEVAQKKITRGMAEEREGRDDVQPEEVLKEVKTEREGTLVAKEKGNGAGSAGSQKNQEQGVSQDRTPALLILFLFSTSLAAMLKLSLSLFLYVNVPQPQQMVNNTEQPEAAADVQAAPVAGQE